MRNSEQGSPERELTKEEKLQIAKDLAVAYYENYLALAKRHVQKDEASIRRGLHRSSGFLTIDAERREVEDNKEFIKKAKNGDFFSKSSLGSPSIYYFQKRSLEAYPREIEELKKEQGDTENPEIKEYEEEEKLVRSIVEAIEQTEEFRDFQTENE